MADSWIRSGGHFSRPSGTGSAKSTVHSEGRLVERFGGWVPAASGFAPGLGCTGRGGRRHVDIADPIIKSPEVMLSSFVSASSSL